MVCDDPVDLVWAHVTSDSFVGRARIVRPKSGTPKDEPQEIRLADGKVVHGTYSLEAPGDYM